MAYDYKSHNEWVRRFIFEHPNASIDDIARAASNAGRGLPRSVITDIRREVDHALAKESDKPPKTAPFNPPKLVTEPQPPKAPPPAPPPTEQPAAYMDPGTKEDRRKFVDDFLLEHPAATGTDLKTALRVRFGAGVANEYLAQALLAVREATGIVPKGAKVRPGREGAAAQSEAPVEIDTAILQAAKTLKASMRVGRVRKVVITVEDVGGSFEVDFATELHTGRTGKVTL